MKKILCNAFSLQMVAPELLARVRFEPIEAPTQDEIYRMYSAIGHADTAAELDADCNRVSIELTPDTELYVAQLQGGRPPEGSTELPEGFQFQWVKVSIELSSGRMICNNGMVS